MASNVLPPTPRRGSLPRFLQWGAPPQPPRKHHSPSSHRKISSPPHIGPLRKPTCPPLARLRLGRPRRRRFRRFRICLAAVAPAEGSQDGSPGGGRNPRSAQAPNPTRGILGNVVFPSLFSLAFCNPSRLQPPRRQHPALRHDVSTDGLPANCGTLCDTRSTSETEAVCACVAVGFSSIARTPNN